MSLLNGAHHGVHVVETLQPDAPHVGFEKNLRDRLRHPRLAADRTKDPLHVVA